jgi:cytochrome c-type biogenesis protein CcmH/NrfF
MKRLAEILLFCCMIVLLMGADNQEARYQKLGHKIMCTCGDCTYLLLECNHVGCPNSSRMIKQLRVNVQREADDEKVLEWFRQTWGVTAVVEPRTHGFELLAWVLPGAALGLGFLLVVVLIRNWRSRPAQAAPATKLDPRLEALRERARRETEL